MRLTSRHLVLWLVLGALGAALLVWAYPHVFPFPPEPWTVTREKVRAIALERLADLGEPVEDAHVVVLNADNVILERRLQTAGREQLEALREAGLTAQVSRWQVWVYSPEAIHRDWTYRADISRTGQLLAMRRRVDPREKGAPIDPQRARDQADAFLVSQGVDLTRFDEPEIRSQQLAARTDLEVRYRHRVDPPGEGTSHGLQVLFAGDRLAGFEPWVDDPGETELRASLRGVTIGQLAALIVIYPFLLLLAPPFLKRYHEGEIGVRRGAQIFLLILACGAVLLLLGAAAQAQASGNLQSMPRSQAMWGVFVIMLVFFLMPAAVLAFFAWSVGESVCRERWGHKLAAFDALLQRSWATATVARSSLVGLLAGVALAGLLAVVLAELQRLGGGALLASSPSMSTALPGLELVLGSLAYGLPVYLAILLWLLPTAMNRLGRVPGFLVAVLLGSLTMAMPIWTVSLGGMAAVSVLFFSAVAGLFLAYDLLAALLASLVSTVLLAAYPLLTAADTSLRVHGWVAMGLMALPLLASVRRLRSGQEFVYRYEDVPPHVRRIAERERQRVELETARRIQSSILPELPPSLHGVEIAHAYLPASEVGGDFYDVLALEDGRVAVAVGDVAGHGVSSGLVMAMAKSALAVQATFDPDVAAVFRTLNRTIFQTARKRLLATLCYALIDPRRRELLYASAGHLFPYRISTAGKVESLESVAYPLGVRGELRVEPQLVELEPGDTLFLFSDGLVEARPENSDQLFGFDRLEQSLARHAQRGPEGLRDGVLADVERHTGNVPREDDQTILVLRLA